MLIVYMFMFIDEISGDDIGVMLNNMVKFLENHTSNMKIRTLEHLQNEDYTGCENSDSVLFYDSKNPRRYYPEHEIDIGTERYYLTYAASFDPNASKNGIDFKFSQRWYSSETYEYIRNGVNDPNYSRLRRCHVVVYERLGFNMELNSFVQDKLIRQQTYAKCLSHGNYLARIHNDTQIPCQIQNCNRISSYRCPHKYGQGILTSYCTTTLCNNHLEESMANGTVMELPCIERNVDELNRRVEQREYEEVSLEFGIDDDVTIADENDIDRYCEDVIDSHLYYGLDEAAKKDQLRQPIYTKDGKSEHGFTESFNGSLLFNHFGSMRSELRGYEKQPLLLQSYMQAMFATHKNISVSVMDFEALIFPQIFPYCENESAIGAMPVSMFLNPLIKRNQNYASIMDHFKIRTLDQTLLTSMETDYTHFIFNAMINSMVSNHFIFHAIKKGVEFLKRPKEGVRINYTEASMMYDTVENRTPAVELGAISSEFKIHIFLTFTASMEDTPGISVQCKTYKNDAIEKCKKEHKYEPKYMDMIHQKVMTSNLGSLTRGWDRVVRWYERYITHGEDRPFGEIQAYWSR